MIRQSDPTAPSTPGRRYGPEVLLPAACLAGRQAGVTRLADLTGLDRVGMPVWQAVRPLSRALSVHQGKGASAAAARLGALLEAVESHYAESFVSDGPSTSCAMPPPGLSTTELRALLLPRHALPTGPIGWTRCEELVGGGAIHVPEDVVSLDLTRDTGGPFERCSSGLAVGCDVGDASAVALCELIERDAIGEWRRNGALAALASHVDPETVPFGWWSFWRDRVAAANVSLALYRVPALAELPVFAVTLRDRTRDAIAYRATHGTGCHPDPEHALFRALAEAIQARATYISGARDDLDEEDYAGSKANEIVVAFALPPPSGGNAWEAKEPLSPLDTAALVDRLAKDGITRIGCVEIGRPAGLSVVKMIVPELGSLERPRLGG